MEIMEKKAEVNHSNTNKTGVRRIFNIEKFKNILSEARGIGIITLAIASSLTLSNCASPGRKTGPIPEERRSTVVDTTNTKGECRFRDIDAETEILGEGTKVSLAKPEFSKCAVPKGKTTVEEVRVKEEVPEEKSKRQKKKDEERKRVRKETEHSKPKEKIKEPREPSTKHKILPQGQEIVEQLLNGNKILIYGNGEAFTNLTAIQYLQPPPGHMTYANGHAGFNLGYDFGILFFGGGVEVNYLYVAIPKGDTLLEKTALDLENISSNLRFGKNSGLTAVLMVPIYYGITNYTFDFRTGENIDSSRTYIEPMKRFKASIGAFTTLNNLYAMLTANFDNRFEDNKYLLIPSYSLTGTLGMGSLYLSLTGGTDRLPVHTANIKSLEIEAKLGPLTGKHGIVKIDETTLSNTAIGLTLSNNGRGRFTPVFTLMVGLENADIRELVRKLQDISSDPSKLSNRINPYGKIGLTFFMF